MTAVVLLALFVPSVLLSWRLPFVLLTLGFVSLGVWEWARLQGVGARSSVVIGLGFAFVGTVAMWLVHPDASLRIPAVAWLVTSVVWAVLLAVSLRGGSLAWSRWPQSIRVVLGSSLLALAWLALLALRELDLAMLASVLVTVWACDVAAYFGGRRFGKRKLAPSISPGKSWEGVWSGTAGAVSLSLILAFGGFGLYSFLLLASGWAAVLAVCVVIVVLGVCGDLFESLVKRAAGAKDSSGLLPGHGGVLDRLDALLPALPFAAWVVACGGRGVA